MKHIGSITIIAYPYRNGIPMLDHPCNMYYHFYDNEHLEDAKDVFETLIKFHLNYGYVIHSDSKDAAAIDIFVGKNNRVVEFHHPTESKAPIVMLQYEEFEANHTIQDIANEFMEEGEKILNKEENPEGQHKANVFSLADYKKTKSEVSDHE